METEKGYRTSGTVRASQGFRDAAAQNGVNQVMMAVRNLLDETGDLIVRCHDGMSTMEGRLDGKIPTPEPAGADKPPQAVLTGTLEDKLLRANEMLGQLAERIRIAGSRF